MKRQSTIALALSAGMLAAGAAHAQATVKPDGKWRYVLGAGASFASGNSDAKMLNLNAEGVRATAQDKWGVNGRILYGRNDDTTTADLLGLGTRYDRNYGERWFAFGLAEYLRDRPANLSQRLSAGAGIGYHVIKRETTTWDVFAGLGYTDDSYREARLVAGRVRSGFGYAELLLGEESTHKLTDTTSFKQRLVVYPNLSESGEFRSTFDAGLAVAISSTMSLNVTLGHRYVSDPGLGVKKSDLLLVTGISVKFD